MGPFFTVQIPVNDAFMEPHNIAWYYHSGGPNLLVLCPTVFNLLVPFYSPLSTMMTQTEHIGQISISNRSDIDFLSIDRGQEAVRFQGPPGRTPCRLRSNIIAVDDGVQVFLRKNSFFSNKHSTYMYFKSKK